MSEGWVKIHRKIQDNPAYFSETFCRNMAWVDLLILANHETGFFRCRGVKVEVKSGVVGTGLDALAIRWKWSRGKVERFMQEIETEGRIVRQKNNVTTLIVLVNYESYQKNDNTNSKAISKPNSKADGQQTDVNKNEKNNKEEKEKTYTPEFLNFQKWVNDNAKRVSEMKEPFTEDQYLKITAEYTKHQIIHIINGMHNWAKLQNSVSANLTFRNWANREYGKKEEEQQVAKTELVL